MKGSDDKEREEMRSFARQFGDNYIADHKAIEPGQLFTAEQVLQWIERTDASVTLSPVGRYKWMVVFTLPGYDTPGFVAAGTIVEAVSMAARELRSISN